MIDNILKDHLLRCPECNSELDYNNDEIIECSNNLCDNQYPIINEVPTFIDSTPKSSRGFEYQWKKRLNGNFEIDFSKTPIPLSIKNISNLDYTIHTIIEFKNENELKLGDPKFKFYLDIEPETAAKRRISRDIEKGLYGERKPTEEDFQSELKWAEEEKNM